jgi:hypothetical protein
MKVISDSKN